MKEHKVIQYNDYETSTMSCSCGTSLTWSGIDDRVKEFRIKHGTPQEQILTEDGKRAGE